MSIREADGAARALVIVDVQNDFTEGGPLGAPGRDAVAYKIGEYLASIRPSYQLVLTTQDWHIEPGDHFVKHAVHCQAETEGAELDPELSAGAGRPIAELVDVLMHKGLYADDYSGYLAIDEAGRLMPDILGEHGITAIDVCGFAENGCVAATARDANAAGMPVRLITDLSSSSTEEAKEATHKEFAELGIEVINAEEAW